MKFWSDGYPPARKYQRTVSGRIIREFIFYERTTDFPKTRPARPKPTPNRNHVINLKKVKSLQVNAQISFLKKHKKHALLCHILFAENFYPLYSLDMIIF